MTDRTKPFEMATVVERAAARERLNAAFTVLIDPRNDPDSISLAARLAGGEVLTLDGMPGPSAVYDPLAPRHATSDHPTISPAISIEKDSLK